MSSSYVVIDTQQGDPVQLLFVGQGMLFLGSDLTIWDGGGTSTSIGDGDSSKNAVAGGNTSSTVVVLSA